MINTDMALRAMKYRLYPTDEQICYLNQVFGAKRWIFNYFLNENKTRFQNKEKHLSGFDCNLLITQLKKEPDTTWLKSMDDWALKNASADLATAYQNFFNSLSGKRKGKKLEHPKFKKRSNNQSFRTKGIKITENGIRIPKLKTEIPCVMHRDIEGTIKTATISRTPSGKYFIAILTEYEPEIKELTGKHVGIDLGLRDLIITSDGVKFQHPDIQLSKAKKLLKEQQRILSRKQYGSRNYEMQRIKVAKLHEEITNQKMSYYHLISSYLVASYDTIIFENLNVAGMIRNRKLARKIHVASWGVLTGMVKYKCELYGKTYHEIGRFMPSTKTCSCCGHVLDSIKLSVKEWTCPNCGVLHDRDINASTNILQFGLMDLYGNNLPSNRGDGNIIPPALQKFAQ